MADKYDFVKIGDFALDFVNSKVMDTRVVPFYDLFSDYEHIVLWFRHLQVLTDEEVERLCQLAKQDPEKAQNAYIKITSLRDANYRILTAIAHQQEPGAKDIDTLNQNLSEAMKNRKLISTPVGFTWAWEKSDDSLDWMAWPVAHSTAQILASDQVQRIRECNGCYWIFMDTSRNGMRRWCDMKTCGNRAKAHRHYEKIKTSK
jgi:predicted RNA-binding Zn ribbon-like protein